MVLITDGHCGDASNPLRCYRETCPSAMKAQGELAQGPPRISNVSFVTQLASAMDKVVCCWGIHGVFMNQHDAMVNALRDKHIQPFVFGLNAGDKQTPKTPKHPLYLSSKTTLKQWLTLTNAG